MTEFSVKILNETKEESVTADEFQIDERGNLNFWDNDNTQRVAVFADSQWQFLREVK